jgi:hypothetical protein
MSSKTKQLIIKLVIYLIIGFACAFFWHKMKGA